MARLYRRNNALKSEYNSARAKVKLGITVSMVCFILWVANILIFHSFNPLFIVPCFLGFGGGGIYAGLHSQKYEQLKSGVEGKESTTQLLATLPDDYSVISNVQVVHDGRVANIDDVVIGPNGVFVVTAKNHNGMIEGHYSDNKLSQEKMGRGGTPYTKYFYNPIKQVGTQVYLLSQFLKGRGIDVWIQGMVYFSNPEAVVDVDFERKTPVFASRRNGGEKLYSYITGYAGSNMLAAEDINNIVNILR